MITAGHKFREKTETILATTAQTVDFSTLMPRHAVALLSFILTGANNSLDGSGVDRYEMKLGTGLFLQMNPEELQGLLEYLFSRYGGDLPAAADLTWILPFHLMNILIVDLAANGMLPEVGLPSGSDKIVQIFENAANSSAGTATLGWIKSFREPTHVPFLVGHTVSGLTASVNNQIYKMPWLALPTAGFLLNAGSTDFTRIRLHNEDEKGVDQEIFDLTYDQIVAMTQPYLATDAPAVVPVIFGRTLIPRNMYMIVDVGAGYAGTERLVPLQFIPAGGGIPGLPM